MNPMTEDSRWLRWLSLWLGLWAMGSQMAGSRHLPGDRYDLTYILPG
jgi:hypothetical protein